jgi:hypothetical protein
MAYILRGLIMTDRERVVYLTTALKNLVESAERYVIDGSWIEHVHLDVQFGKDTLRIVRLNKVGEK